MDPSTRRFVVLRHQVGPNLNRTTEDHFDWMFQTGESLRSWSSRVIANWESPFSVASQSLADHRIRYLQYEGSISDDRGSVERVAAGTFVASEESPERFVARVTFDTKFSGDFADVTIQRISREGDLLDDNRGDWSIDWLPGRYETN